MLVIGGVLMALFALWDLRYASRPVIAPRFLRNKSVVIASLIGFFDFVRPFLVIFLQETNRTPFGQFSYFVTYVYLHSFILVVKPWTKLQASYFLQVQTIALTVCGFFAGVVMWRVRRCKSILISGLFIRLLYVSLRYIPCSTPEESLLL